MVWNSGGVHRGFRLRCINGSYDFCSGVVSAEMSGGVIIGCVGFVNDHGDYHYILDKTKDGRITTGYLGFMFELCGDKDGVKVEQAGGEYIISDGEIKIILCVKDWVFDGKKAEVRLDASKKTIELIAYKGEEKTIDLNNIGPSYGAFAMSINEQCPQLVGEDVGAEYTVTALEQGIRASVPKEIGSFDEFMSNRMEG